MTTKMGNTTSAWEETFSHIKSKHDLAYRSIEEAIRLEEEEKPNEALEKYKEGIFYIDAALCVQVTCPENPEPTWERACSMIQKMKKTRAEVLMRINSIQSSEEFTSLPLEDPPTYEEATSAASTPTTEVPRTYIDLAAALKQLQVDPNLSVDTNIICTYNNVRLYFISPRGQVVSSTEPDTLKIELVDEGADAPRAVLHVGNWVYPLVPGVSPCYRTDYGAFILPDVHSTDPGSSVGIIVPPEYDEEFYDLLVNILHGVVSQSATKEYKKGKREIPIGEEDLSHKISNKIVNGAFYISQGLIRGAEKAGNLLDQKTPTLMSQMRRSDQPSEIPRSVSRTMEIAENTTGKAAQITGFVADKIGTATMKLGRFLAPHIEKQGTRLLTTGFRMNEAEANAKVKGVLTVAAGAVEGFSTVYNGLETSASILGQNLKNNTVKIVEHKYGVQAGDLTEETLNTAGNVWVINRNANLLQPKGLIKKAAKDTGRAIALGHGANSSRSSFSQASSSQTSPISSLNDNKLWPELPKKKE